MSYHFRIFAAAILFFFSNISIANAENVFPDNLKCEDVGPKDSGISMQYNIHFSPDNKSGVLEIEGFQTMVSYNFTFNNSSDGSRKIFFSSYSDNPPYVASEKEGELLFTLYTKEAAKSQNFKYPYSLNQKAGFVLHLDSKDRILLEGVDAIECSTEK